MFEKFAARDAAKNAASVKNKSDDKDVFTIAEEEAKKSFGDETINISSEKETDNESNCTAVKDEGKIL